VSFVAIGSMKLCGFLQCKNENLVNFLHFPFDREAVPVPISLTLLSVVCQLLPAVCPSIVQFE
jgi:hypothetical protein